MSQQRRVSPAVPGTALGLALLTGLVFSSSRVAQAQEPAAVTGSLRLGGWSGTRTLDDREGAASVAWWAKGSAPLGSRLGAYVEGWAGYRDMRRRQPTSGTLREAYLDMSLGPVEVRAGRQLVVWGRADGINPTDNIAPRDFTLLVADDEDQRFGLGAVKASVYAGSLCFTALWLPEMEGHVVPLPAFPPTFTVSEVRPTTARSLAQVAVRLEQSGLEVDWSLSYFDGFDRVPNLALAAPGALTLLHPRIRVLGADFATVVGRFGVRGEAAYTMTTDVAGGDPQVRNPFAKLVLGGDRTFLENLNVNLQYVLQVVTHFHDPLQLADPDARFFAEQSALAYDQGDRVQQGPTVRVADKWLNETLEAELSGAFFGPTFSYLVRGKVSYALTDRWRILLGFDWFDGEQASSLRFLHKNSLAFAEVRLAL